MDFFVVEKVGKERERAIKTRKKRERDYVGYIFIYIYM